MIKRILGWTIFVLIAIFIGFIVWLFLFRESPVERIASQTQRGDSFFPVDLQSGLERQAELESGTTSAQRPGTIPRLRQLSRVPTAGAVAFTRETGSSETFITDNGVESTRPFTVTVFRYIERATGHLYEARENSLTQTRLSNTTIPKTHNAIFTPDGNRALLQYILDDNETTETLSAAVVAKSTTSPETFQLVADGYALEGVFLPQNVVSADITPSGLAYIVKNATGGSSVIISDFADRTKQIIHESPFTEWLVQRISNNRVAITTKADSRMPGFTYHMNTSGSIPTKIIGDINGLTTLVDSDEKWLIYSLSRENELTTFAYNIATKSEMRLGIKTLPEKCVFSPSKNDVLYCGATDQPERVQYPQTWYQGISTFNDNLWEINLATEEYTPLLIDREEASHSFDMTKLAVSPNDKFILFINKKDLTLWSVDLSRGRAE